MATFPLKYTLTCALLIGPLLPSVAQGKWVFDGIPVCTATDVRVEPGMVPNGSGGAIIVWENAEDFAATRTNLYAQRVTGEGVIARTSVMPYKTTEKGIRRISEELGVDYILEGSVRRESDLLRITTQLVRVDHQTPMSAECYDRTFEDVFSVQRDVAERTSASLALTVLPPAKGQMAPIKSRAAHHAYLKARYFLDQGTEQGFYATNDYFRMAVAEDPLFARAYTGRANAQIGCHGQPW